MAKNVAHYGAPWHDEKHNKRGRVRQVAWDTSSATQKDLHVTGFSHARAMEYGFAMGDKIVRVNEFSVAGRF